MCADQDEKQLAYMAADEARIGIWTELVTV